MSRVYQPTAEDLAKAEERRLKKEQAKSNPTPVKVSIMEDERGNILPREWVDLTQGAAPSAGQNIRVMSWNVGTVSIASCAGS